MQASTHALAYTHTHTHTRTHCPACTHARTDMYARVLARRHAQVLTHTHTHTCCSVVIDGVMAVYGDAVPVVTKIADHIKLVMVRFGLFGSRANGPVGWADRRRDEQTHA